MARAPTSPSKRATSCDRVILAMFLVSWAPSPFLPADDADVVVGGTATMSSHPLRPAGVLVDGILLSPAVGAVLMSLSTVVSSETRADCSAARRLTTEDSRRTDHALRESARDSLSRIEFPGGCMGWAFCRSVSTVSSRNCSVSRRIAASPDPSPLSSAHTLGEGEWAWLSGPGQAAGASRRDKTHPPQVLRRLAGRASPPGSARRRQSR